MRFSEAEKKKILSEILQDKKSVSLVAKRNNLSRKTIYKWLKLKDLSPKYKKGKKHHASKYAKAYRYINRWVVAHPDWGCRRLGSELVKKGMKMSHVQINALLNRMGAENYDRRINYARNFSGPARFKKDVRHEVVYKYIEGGVSISKLSEDYKLARKTIYSWIKRYQGGHELNDRYVFAQDHPKAIYPKITKSVLDLVSANPSFSVHTLSKMIPASSWTIWKILDRNGLNTVSARLAYVAKRPEPAAGFVSRVFDKIKQPFYSSTPQTLPAPPPYKVFFQSLLISFVLLLGFANLATTITSVGMFFAFLALLMGSFFFLYSLKYYITLAIVLSYSSEDVGTNPVRTGKNRSFLNWILGDIKTEKTRTLGLESNLDNIFLKEKPFVSVHVALFKRKDIHFRLYGALERPSCGWN